MKYNYLKVIQSCFGKGWDDEAIYFTDSRGRFFNKDERTLFRHDLKEYRLATGNRIRVINRRELRAMGDYFLETGKFS